MFPQLVSGTDYLKELRTLEKKVFIAGSCYSNPQKKSLDKEVFKNCRPVSNLNFISKIHKRVSEAGIMTSFQSAYRKYHSTENALLNVQNDIVLNIAKGSVTALTLLDPCHFDTIYHTIPLDRLHTFYEISELALC